MNVKNPVALFLTLLAAMSAMAACTLSNDSTLTTLQTSRTKFTDAVAVVEVLGCRAVLRKASGSKASFILEPLLCWQAGMEQLLCSGFDYLRSRHFLRVPVLLTDPTAPDLAKRLLHKLFPTSLQFMDIESISFQLTRTDRSADVELEDQFSAAGSRKYLMIRAYCTSLAHCQDIRLGIATQPSIFFERIRLSLSSGANTTVRSVSSGSLVCQGGARQQLQGSSSSSSNGQSKEASLEAAAGNSTRLVELDGQLYVLVQQRSVGDVSFRRSWLDYENGFGYVSGDYWMGLRLLHSLTKASRVLRVELVRSHRAHSFHQDFFHAEYNEFKVGPPPLYVLSYSAFNRARSSVLSDGLAECRGRSFSTMDRDNDIWPNSCSNLRGGGGGWWFSGCGVSNPNGEFNGSSVGSAGAIRWGYLDSMTPNQGGDILKGVRILLRV